MTDKPLNAKERRFVEEYLIDLDPKRAAIEAGYSKTVAATKAYQWVSDAALKPHVYAAIAEAKAKRSERTRIDADWVLQRLAKLEQTSIGDFLMFPEGGGTPVFDLSAATQAQMSGIEGLQIDCRREKGADGGVVEKIKITLPNKLKTLELIGKHVDVQAYRDRLAVEEPNILDQLTFEEMEALLGVLDALDLEDEKTKVGEEDTLH